MYTIADSHYSNRPMYYEPGKATVEWIAVPGFGHFKRNVDAKRAWLIAMQEIKPDGEYTDDHIRGMFRYFQNTETAKVIKV